MKPNLIITDVCNLNCSYCFASESRTDERKVNKHMSLEQFKFFVNKFCQEEKKVTFCGGEPSLNPDIIKMIEFALREKKYSIEILTNGVWPDPVYNYFKNFYSDMNNLFLFGKISYLVNIPEYVYKYDKKKIGRVKEILNFLPGRSKSLSLTFDKPDFDGMYLIEIARECGVKRFRQSFAAPYINDNKDINFVHQYRKYAISLVRFIREANQAGIKKVGADCGYIPYCAFTKEELSDILIAGNTLISLCSHDGPVDISKDYNWRCYGLFGLETKSNSEEDTRNSLESYWSRTAQLLYNFSIFKNCDNCYYWHNYSCRGGCHTTKAKYVINNYSKELLYPLEKEELFLECIPVKSPLCSLYTNPTGKTIVIVASGAKTVKLVNVKFNYTFALLELCDGVNNIKTLADILVEHFKTDNLTFSDILEHIKFLYDLRVIDLIPEYLNKLINRIELEQTHQRLMST